MSVVLKANGKIFSGWINAEVERSLKAVSGHFSIGLTDRWNGQTKEWTLYAGDECSIEIDGEKIISGIVDTVEADLASDTRHLSVTGRDRTGNLVDSGSLAHQTQFKGQTLKQVVATLANPFGVSVSSLSVAANESIKVTALQYSETIWEIINRLAHYQGVLAYPDSNGGIIFSDIATQVSTSIDEKNVLEVNVKTDASQKFQKYIVVSHSGSTDDRVTTRRAIAIDNSVKTPRTKIIVLSNNNENSGAQARANWELAMQTAKSFQANVTVVGWRNNKGNIWQINTLITLNAPTCGVTGNYLIESTRFILDQEKGMITQLVLVLPDAYKPQPDRQDSQDLEL